MSIVKNKLAPVARVLPPRGYKFRIHDSKYHCTVSLVSLKDTYLEVGYIRLELVRENRGKKYYMTHSYLSDNLRGKGYGAKLYAKAIQWCLRNGHSVSSSYSPSCFAQGVWKGQSIRKYFSIRKKTNKFGSFVWMAYRKRV